MTESSLIIWMAEAAQLNLKSITGSGMACECLYRSFVEAAGWCFNSSDPLKAYGDSVFLSIRGFIWTAVIALLLVARTLL